MKLSEIKQLRACFDRLRGSSVDTLRNFSWEMRYALEDLISVFEQVRDLRREKEPVDPFNPFALLQDYFDTGSDGELSDQITAMREDLYGSVKITLPELDSRRFFEKAIRPNLHGLDGLLHQLWHAARTGAEVGINAEERYFYYYTAPKLPTIATYLAMDFTGNGKRLELVLDRAKELVSNSDYPTAVSTWGRDNIGIDWVTNPGSRIVQVGKASNAKSNLPMRKERIRRVLMAIHKRHPRSHVAVISYKGWEKKLEFQALKEVFGKRMTYDHYFNLRGSNDLQENSVFIIIGTPFLPFRDYCQIARDYYADPLIPDVDAKALASLGKNLDKKIQIQALKVASRNERLINVNPAELVVEKPVAEKNLDMEVWTQDEVRRFLRAAREAGLQSEAFYTLTIESGMRKGEVCGLKWEDVEPYQHRRCTTQEAQG